MCSHHEGPDELQDLIVIGIKNLSGEQLNCLVQLKLKYFASCLLLFKGWIDEGVYDFCCVPFQLKAHMNASDRKALVEVLPEKWRGSTDDLLKELNELINVLRHSEDNIIKSVNRCSQVRRVTTFVQG